MLAGTGVALALHTEAPIPPGYDPLAARFSHVSRGLKSDSLGSELQITEADLAAVRVEAVHSAAKAEAM